MVRYTFRAYKDLAQNLGLFFEIKFARKRDRRFVVS